MDKSAKELLDGIIQLAHKYEVEAKKYYEAAKISESEAKKLYDAAKVIDPNFLNNRLSSYILPLELFGKRKTRKEQIVAVLAGKKGLKRKELKALLPNMPQNTFAHLLSHERDTFIQIDRKWYLKGEEPE